MTTLMITKLSAAPVTGAVGGAGAPYPVAALPGRRRQTAGVRRVPAVDQQHLRRAVTRLMSTKKGEHAPGEPHPEGAASGVGRGRHAAPPHAEPIALEAPQTGVVFRPFDEVKADLARVDSDVGAWDDPNISFARM